MSNHVASLVRRRRTDLGPTAKAVLLLLADIASDDGSGIWASKQTLANELEMSRRAFQNAIAALVEANLLSEVGSRHHSNGKTIEYRIEVSILRGLPPTKVPKSENTSAADAPVTTTSSGGCTNDTSAADAPVQDMHVTGARGARQDVHEVHTNHPITPLEPSSSSSAREDASRSSGSDASLLDRVIAAAGIKPHPLPKYWMPPASHRHVESWKVTYDLTDDQVVEVVEAEAGNAREKGLDPAAGPKAFDDGMRRLALELCGNSGTASRPRSRADPDRSYLTDLDFTRKAGGDR